jgi:hypothetical protein
MWKCRYASPEVTSLSSSADTIKREITSLNKSYQQQLQTFFSGLDSKVAFTTDAWSSMSRKPFMGVTAHFITDSWELESLELDFVELQSHTGKQIAKQFTACLKKFGLESKVRILQC